MQKKIKDLIIQAGIGCADQAWKRMSKKRKMKSSIKSHTMTPAEIDYLWDEVLDKTGWRDLTKEEMEIFEEAYRDRMMDSEREFKGKDEDNQDEQ